MTPQATSRLTVALVSEVFHEADGGARLRRRLAEAREAGADLAVLPELPLNPWSPATREPAADDAEELGGPRTSAQADAAREAGIGVVGGIIRRDAAGRRASTALVFDAAGSLVATYEKLHLPEEPGFWETSHYEPGRTVPCSIGGFAMPIGVQICSDVNRPVGTHLLAAQGVEVVVCPRATERATWERWRVVLRANALTSGAFVVSVNRPGPDGDVGIGGPSFAVGPDDGVLIETTDPLAIVTLEREVVERARAAYPGYLAIRSDLYAEGWRDIPPRPSRGITPP
jgi:predicted amidohydrolase